MENISLKKILNYISYSEQEDNGEYIIPENTEAVLQSPSIKDYADIKVPKTLKENLEIMQNAFYSKTNKDIVLREFSISEKVKGFVAFIDGMINGNLLNEYVIKPILITDYSKYTSPKNIQENIQNIIQIGQIQRRDKIYDAINGILMGNTVVYFDGFDEYIECETKGFDRRGVGEPKTEGSIKGSQEAFTENMKTNIILVRKIIKNPKLTTEYLNAGRLNNCMCAILYIEGLTNPDLVNEVKRRIKNLKSDFVSGSGMLEQFIEDNPFSIFPNMLSTERPDRTAFHLSDGRVVVIVDGTPFSLVMPITVTNFMHTTEDAELRWEYSSLLRLIRSFSVFISILLPGLYIALTTFHAEMIPTQLLISIATARENVPFPTILEILIMQLSFELIREASLRVPGIIGNMIGIVGALIIGQAAVEANIVSPVTIIVVAFTGVGTFAIPDYGFAFGMRILNLFFIIIGAVFGFIGVAMGIILVYCFLSVTQTFGSTQVLSHTVSAKTKNRKWYKPPVWHEELRPSYVKATNPRKQEKISRAWKK